MKKIITILLTMIVCISMVSCSFFNDSSGSSLVNDSQIESETGSEDSSDVESDVESDDSSDVESDDNSDSGSNDNSDTESSGGNVVTPIQPDGDYNVGDGYGK